jgi:hypothetical protein
VIMVEKEHYYLLPMAKGGEDDSANSAFPPQ